MGYRLRASASSVFDWIKADIRPSAEVESWLNANPELRPLVENVVDNGESYADLNAAGELLFQAAAMSGPRAVWPEASPNSPQKKYGVSGVDHHRPDGWKRFVDTLCRIDCISYLRYSEDAYGGTPVKVLNAEKGMIGVRFGTRGNELPLLVETTARGTQQTELVAAHIRRMR